MPDADARVYEVGALDVVQWALLLAVVFWVLPVRLRQYTARRQPPGPPADAGKSH